IDSPRFITNQVSLDCSTSNALFAVYTSDSNLVSYFSSAGNVSPTLEGEFGRFKPDVVAPGVFTVSDRSTNYIDPTNQETVGYLLFPGQVLNPGQPDQFSVVIPSGTQLAWFQVTPNDLSFTPFPTNI